jgi:2-dehydro-3-deoxyphosphogluconate aldolase / (4S)-4-hydroxy-2-oxoglutarate aldolase
VNIREIAALAPVIPVLKILAVEHAVPLARALAAGGLRAMEITLRTPVALAAIEAIRQGVPEAVVGVGGLTRAVDFAAAGRVGAHFGVSPGLTPELAAAARGARFPLLPGIMTPTELILARHAGFNVLQLYPAEHAGGVALLQTLAAGFPDVLFCPAGAMTRAAAADYLGLPNVLCVGASWVAPAALSAAGDWAGIEALARDAAALARHAAALARNISSP